MSFNPVSLFILSDLYTKIFFYLKVDLAFFALLSSIYFLLKFINAIFLKFITLEKRFSDCCLFPIFNSILTHICVSGLKFFDQIFFLIKKYRRNFYATIKL